MASAVMSSSHATWTTGCAHIRASAWTGFAAGDGRWARWSASLGRLPACAPRAGLQVGLPEKLLGQFITYPEQQGAVPSHAECAPPKAAASLFGITKSRSNPPLEGLGLPVPLPAHSPTGAMVVPLLRGWLDRVVDVEEIRRIQAALQLGQPLVAVWSVSLVDLVIGERS